MVSCRSFRSWGHFSKKNLLLLMSSIITSWNISPSHPAPRPTDWPSGPVGQNAAGPPTPRDRWEGCGVPNWGPHQRAYGHKNPAAKPWLRGTLLLRTHCNYQTKLNPDGNTNKQRRGCRPMVYKGLFAASQALRSTRILAYGHIESQNL